METTDDTTSSEVLSHIEDTVNEVLKQNGVSSAIAMKASLTVSERITADFGGQLVYFKKCVNQNTEDRHAALIADFETGDYTRGELAKKYNMSIQNVYRILKTAK